MSVCQGLWYAKCMHAERPPQTIEIHKGTVVFDETGAHWEKAMTAMLEKSTAIIALRGAGSFNGISISDAKKLLEERIFPRVDQLLQRGNVISFIFDGDNDDPACPDVGHIMGRLLDSYHEKIDFYAVQKAGWYKYRNHATGMRPLHSATGNEYETYVFPDKTFPGEHDHFSQNVRLVQSPKYEQWYVGACGLIASQQLADYAKNVASVDGEHRVIIFKAAVSVDQELKIQRKIAESSDAIGELEGEAIKGGFEAVGSIQEVVDKKARLSDSLIRRNAHRYGLLFDAAGNFIQKPEYGGLVFTVVE